MQVAMHEVRYPHSQTYNLQTWLRVLVAHLKYTKYRNFKILNEVLSKCNIKMKQNNFLMKII